MKFFNLQRGKLWLALLLLALTLPSHLTNVDRAVNIDEPWWVISSANFYYAVTHRDFQDTYFEYHPGVMNMWIISAAMSLTASATLSGSQESATTGRLEQTQHERDLPYPDRVPDAVGRHQRGARG